MKYKIIFVDIDWTILDHEKHDFDYPSIEALKQAQDKGMLVYLCTARPYDSVYHTGILSHLHPDGIVCTNGAVVFVNDKVIQSITFPREIMREIANYCKENNYILELSTERERFFTQEKNDLVDEYFSYFAEVVPPVREYHDEDISEVLLFSYEKDDEKIQKALPKGVTMFRFASTASDLQITPISKDLGIKKVLSYLNINKEEAIAIGDDYGDIPMFEAVGFSIAMGNGRPEAHEKAKMVTKKISESGLKHALQELKII